ncbi:hypothetical protein QBC40DRAFT_99019 [Triangularia verruculosa]|uniref:Ankyrin repeat protein n=1 Tax=Triangularia verruculosa TaxID=2587418 RepID=A0AAN7ATE1_9PEZI|nr:hypothetical protein QBC40DRAFT_99019 [Triangularia verruculosa]
MAKTGVSPLPISISTIMPADMMPHLGPGQTQAGLVMYGLYGIDTFDHVDANEYQVSFPVNRRRPCSSVFTKPCVFDSMASSPSPGSVTTTAPSREGSRIGRPPQWTVSRSRKLARLYLYTTLSIERIIRVLEDDVFKPRKNSAQKTIHKMLDNDPRYLRPESRIEMNQRISNLVASTTRRRKNMGASTYESGAHGVTLDALYSEKDNNLAKTEVSSISGSSRRVEEGPSFDFAGSPDALLSPIRWSLPLSAQTTEVTDFAGSSDRCSAMVQDLKRRLSDCSTNFARQVTSLIKDFTIAGSSQDEISSGRRPSAALSDRSDHDDLPETEISHEPFEAFPEPAFAVPGDFLSAHRRNCADFPGQQHGVGDCWCSIAAETSTDQNSWLLPTGELGVRARHILNQPSPSSLGLRDSFGNTALHLFATLEGYQDVLFRMVLSSDIEILKMINTAGQTFLHTLNLEWFFNLAESSTLLRQLLSYIKDTAPDLVYEADVYGRTFFHRAYALVRDPAVLGNLFSPFDPLRAAHRDAFGFNPLGSIVTDDQGPYIPPRRGGSMSPQAEYLTSSSTGGPSRGHSASPSDNDSFLAYHARLVEVIQSSYNNPQMEDAEGRNGLHCLAEAILNQQSMNRHVSSSSISAPSIHQRPSLKRKLGSSKESITSFPSPSSASATPATTPANESTLTTRLRHLTGLLHHSQVDVNAYDKSGNTPLMAFITHISDDQDDKSKTLLAILETLIRAKGSKIEARNRRGETALLVAARLGRKIALTTLLEHGANVHARDVDGRGVLEVVDEVCKGAGRGDRGKGAGKGDVSLYARAEACRVLLTGRRDWGVVGKPGVEREWRV